MQKAYINGTELEFEVAGEGEPLLLISTGPIIDSFLPLFSLPGIAERYQLIRYRQRSAEEAGDAILPVKFETHAADAVALLSYLGIRRAHVAGHSTGAAIALQMALDFPDAVHSLALLEPPLLASQNAQDFLQRVGPAFEAFQRGEGDLAIEKFLSVVCSLEWDACAEVIDRAVPGGAAAAKANARNVFASYLPALAEWQFGPELATTIRQPVLSVVGSDSDRLFIDSHGLLKEWFRQLETSPIRDVAHLLVIQSPQPVARALDDFFARHPIAASAAGASSQRLGSRI